MRNRIRENCRKPEGFFGKLSILRMNKHHKELSLWGMESVSWENKTHILELGCGGGVHLHRMLKDYPQAIIDGIDYSNICVINSQKENKKFLEKRCHIYLADVMDLPFTANSYDAIVGIETIYFWPDLIQGFQEVRRVLKDSGEFLIIVEVSNPKRNKDLCLQCPGMKVYSEEEIIFLLKQAGFDKEIKINRKGEWLSILAVK